MFVEEFQELDSDSLTKQTLSRAKKCKTLVNGTRIAIDSRLSRAVTCQAGPLTATIATGL
jgi:hypothetical protein